MGIEPFLVASAIDCVVAQRLARTLCAELQGARRVLDADVLRGRRLRRRHRRHPAFEAVGCARCGGTGYRGRIGLYEVMTVNEEIRSLVMRERAPATRSPRPRSPAACARCATTAWRRCAPA